MRKKNLETTVRLFQLVLTVCIGVGMATMASAADDVLRVVETDQLNGFDVANDKVDWSVYGLNWNVCDRLVTYGLMETIPGYTYDDANIVKGELAESWEWSDDNLKLTLKIKEGAKFHNGDPVTAEDVVWSLARASVTPRSKNQMKVGGMVREDQFKALDRRTIQISLDEPNRFTLIDLIVPMAVIYNSKLIKANATADDPWGLEWANNNPDGICSGAYKIDKFTPNESVILTRNEDWVGGPAPDFQKIIYQTVKETSSIATLLERGRADFSKSLSTKELKGLEKRGKVKTQVIGHPFASYAFCFDMKTKMFADKRVRHAMAYAAPYQGWVDTVFFGKAGKLYGGKTNTPEDISMLQPFPFDTDIEKAKMLLKEAGIPEGTVYPFYYPEDRKALYEPFAVLLKENLQKIGYDLELKLMTAAQFAEARNTDEVEMYIDLFGAWLGGAPDYFFRIFWSGDWRDNMGNYENPELIELLKKNAVEFDKAEYKKQVQRMIAMAMDDLPFIPMINMPFNYVQAKGVTCVQTSFNFYPDWRLLKRGEDGQVQCGQ